MTHINWPDLMRAGLVQLRLRPDQFWALTPSELMIMLGQGGSHAPMDQARLTDLLRLYPDGAASLDIERTK